MSDHISGPRALAEPIADITDFYAFPSPERPGYLVLAMNTMPFATPSQPFSEALIYRFRVRPPSAASPIRVADRVAIRPAQDRDAASLTAIYAH